MIQLLIALLLVMSEQTLAKDSSEKDSCEPVNLSSGFGETRDQGDSGWCGSFVAADLLGFELGARLSAASVGVNYYVHRSSAEAFLLDTVYGPDMYVYGGAFLSSVFSVNLSQPVCPESEFPDSNVATALAELAEKIRKTRAGEPEPQFCVHPLDLSSLHLHMEGTDWRPNPSLSLIHQRLSLQKPVAAIVDAEKLFDSQSPPSPLVVRTFGDHFVSVIGRKVIAGKCHLLVRNSYGSDCSGYEDDGISSCESGQLWIEQKHFEGALKNVLYLESNGH